MTREILLCQEKQYEELIGILKIETEKQEAFDAS